MGIGSSPAPRSARWPSWQRPDPMRSRGCGRRAGPTRSRVRSPCTACSVASAPTATRTSSAAGCVRRIAGRGSPPRARSPRSRGAGKSGPARSRTSSIASRTRTARSARLQRSRSGTAGPSSTRRRSPTSRATRPLPPRRAAQRCERSPTWVRRMPACASRRPSRRRGCAGRSRGRCGGWRRAGSATAMAPGRRAMKPEEYRLLRELIHQHCGLWFTDDVAYLLEARLGPRLQYHGLDDFGSYYRFLRFDAGRGAELEAAVEALTTKETYLYREPQQLRAFYEEILPAIAAQNGRQRRLRIWSAGCSTGEEVYTIAILLARTGLFHGWDLDVFGSDIVRRVVAVARAGSYGPR